MKYILVLTDFSPGAWRAAECALPVAAKLGADVLLVNVYPITPYLPPANVASWPLNGQAEKRHESTLKLNREVRRLEKRRRSLHLSGHQPAIHLLAMEGQLADCVSRLTREKNTVLIMMGVSGKSYGNALFDGEVKAVLQQVVRPVLVIPANWEGPEVRHILYATDLAAADEDAIAELVGLAAPLMARVSLSHVSRPVLVPDFAEEVRVSAFLEKIESLYPMISCYPVRGDNIMSALEMIGGEKQADVIALRFQSHPIWYRLFHENPLKEAIEHGQTPLLIFPEDRHRHD